MSDAGRPDDGLATLRALRLADSFLPVGAYTASYGLESAVESGRVEDVEDLTALLADYLHHQIGPADVVVLARAHDAAAAGDLDRVAEIDRRQRAVTMPAEFRESSTKSGRRLLELLVETEDDEAIERYLGRVDAGTTPGNYAAALGLAAARLGIPRREACLAHGHSFAVGLLGAAQRLLRLGHTDVQRMLADLGPVIREAVVENEGRPVDRLEPFAPAIDLFSMDHERADRRLFIS